LFHQGKKEKAKKQREEYGKKGGASFQSAKKCCSFRVERKGEETGKKPFWRRRNFTLTPKGKNSGRGV